MSAKTPSSSGKCYIETNRPTLQIRQRTGRRFTWGCHLIVRVVFTPKNAQRDNDAKRHDTLKVDVGDDQFLVVGHNLAALDDGLANGQGGVIQEGGERHEAYDAPGPGSDELYVTRIIYQDPDDKK